MRPASVAWMKESRLCSSRHVRTLSAAETERERVLDTIDGTPPHRPRSSIMPTEGSIIKKVTHKMIVSTLGYHSSPASSAFL